MAPYYGKKVKMKTKSYKKGKRKRNTTGIN